MLQQVMGDEIIEALQAASSQDVHLVKFAEAKIKSWETTHGFCSALLDVYLNRALDVSIRWIAVICLKNIVSRFWRKNVTYVIANDEKECIRKKILCFDEPAAQLATQVAVVISKIVRIDIKIWQDAIQLALQNVKSDVDLIQHRALLTLNRIMEELASKRLMADRRTFEQISNNCFSYLTELTKSHTAQLINGHLCKSLKLLEITNLLTKVLRKLVVYGARTFASNSMQAEYMRDCFKVVDVLLKTNCSGMVQEKFRKLISLYMKLFIDSLEQQTASFATLVEPAVCLTMDRIMSSNNCSDFEKMSVHCGSLLTGILRSYKSFNKSSDQMLDAYKVVGEIKARYFTSECIQRLSEHLIFNYFTLTDSELAEWQNDPEELSTLEAGESHKFVLGPCMETLFVCLFYEYKTVVIPKLLHCVQMVDTMTLSEISQGDCLKICAVLKAVGLASYELFDDLNYDQWFQNTLVKLLNVPDQVILHERILWMTGQWVNVKFSQENRVLLYRAILHFLQNVPDIVVRITACKTLRYSLDDFDFNAENFSPFADETFVALCNLLAAVKSCDLKLTVLNAVSLMVERLGEHVKQGMDMLVGCVLRLWEVSADHNLLRGAVINLMTHIVDGYGPLCTSIDHLTLPMIAFSTSIEQPAHVYLLEDALQLWLSVVKHRGTMNADLLAMYRNVLVLLERASETLDVCLAITEAYILIDSDAFIKSFGGKVSDTFVDLFGNVKETVAVKLALTIRLAVQLSPVETCAQCEKCLRVVMEDLLVDSSPPPLMTAYITLLACLCIKQPQAFMSLVGGYGTEKGISLDLVMDKLLEVWLDKTDCMPLTEKKYTALALVSMLPHKVEFIVNQFALILDLCVNVLYDLQKHTDGDVTNDYLVTDLACEEDCHQENKKITSNPAHSIVLLDYVRNQLNSTKTSYGEVVFSQAIETLDSAVASQLMSLIN